MPNTTYLTLPYPALSNAPNVPQDMQNLATGVDNKLIGVITCTSGTRPTVRDGAVIFETDTKRYMYYSAAGTAWRMLDSHERFAARKTSSIAADSATWTATESGSLISVTPTLTTGLTYKLLFSGAVSSDAVTSGVETTVMRIREDTATGNQLIVSQVFIPTTSTIGFLLTAYVEYTAVATGAKTFVVTGTRNGGTGNHRIRAATGRSAWLTCDLLV
jgi:hypothetical protein